MPQDLFEAIAHANKVLDWFENLTTEDIPPEWMWPFSDEITIWFDDIKQKKADEISAGDTGDTVAPMEKNEHPMADKLRALRGK